MSYIGSSDKNPLSALLGVGEDIHIPILLAPMAGVADMAFRRICMEYGCDFSYSEMVSAKGLSYNNKNTRALLEIAPEIQPAGIQLFGHEPDVISETISKLNNEYAGRIRLIDINMGCPAPKIVSNGEGCALMRDIPRAASIINSAVKASTLPITVKFRMGFNDNEKNALEFARMAEDMGAAAVTVHGRTRAQMYSGTANWDIIGEIKSRLSIPVIGNGDVFSGEAALKLLHVTQCDGIMVARGARGNPFIFEEIKAALSGKPAKKITPEQKIQAAIRHMELHCQYAGASAFVRMRKHLLWYTHGLIGGAFIREAINTCQSPSQAIDILMGCLEHNR